MSTVEAEYIVVADCALEIVWIRQLLKDLGYEQKGPMPLMVDNLSSIQMATNPSNHSRTKHIKLRYHKIRELVDSGEITVGYVSTDHQLADIFTKALTKDKHQSFIATIGLENSA